MLDPVPPRPDPLPNENQIRVQEEVDLGLAEVVQRAEAAKGS